MVKSACEFNVLKISLFIDEETNITLLKIDTSSVEIKKNHKVF